jgi:hypothetical protein
MEELRNERNEIVPIILEVWLVLMSDDALV